MGMWIDKVSSAADRDLKLSDIKKRVESDSRFHLKIIDRNRQRQYEKGFEIERFLHYRLRSSPHTPKYYGSLKHRGEYGLVTAYIEEENAFYEYNFFPIFRDDEERRLKSLIVIFMDLFFQLHQIHGPRYAGRFVPQQDELVSGIQERAGGVIHYAHKDLNPRNIRTKKGIDGLTRAVILDFDVAGEIRRQTVYHHPTWFNPPEYQDPRYPPISSPSRDIFSVQGMLFGALSVAGIDWIDFCGKNMPPAPEPGNAGDAYRFFLTRPASKLESDAREEFFSYVAPGMDHIDINVSLFDNLLEYSLRQWDSLKNNGPYEDVGIELREFLRGMTSDSRDSDSPSALQAFNQFAVIWDRISGPDDPGVSDLYPSLGRPAKFEDVNFPFSRIRLPIAASAFELDLEEVRIDGVEPTITLDWRLRPCIDTSHIKSCEVPGGGETFVFERLEVEPSCESIRFEETKDIPHETSRVALLEYGPYHNPIFLPCVFDQRIDKPQWVKKLNIDSFESEISRLFANSTLPGRPRLGTVTDLWKQVCIELDDPLLNKDRRRWYEALAVLVSNIMMIPSSERHDLGLEIEAADVQIQDNKLLENIDALIFIGDNVRFSFDSAFQLGACLHLLRLGYRDLEDLRLDRVDQVHGRLEELITALADGFHRSRIVEYTKYLKTLRRLQGEMPEESPRETET